MDSRYPTHTSPLLMLAHDKDTFGEPSVTANVEGGVVTSLDWNKRDLAIFQK